jgi:hypothetical protein
MRRMPKVSRRMAQLALVGLCALSACKGCEPQSGQTGQTGLIGGNKPPVIGGGGVGGDGVWAAPFLNEKHTGKYASLPVSVPAGEIRVSYTLGEGCTDVVATLGAEIVKASGPKSETAVRTGPGLAGNRALQVTAPPGCSWTIIAAAKK